MNCDNCGKSYTPRRRSGKRANQKNYFCSRQCSFDFRKVTDTEKKICLHCFQEKFLASFGKQKRKDGTFGYSKNCNTCRSKLTKLRKFGKEDLTKPSPYLFCEETMREIKICSKCKTTKPFNEFSTQEGKPTPDCLLCRKVKARINYQNLSDTEKAEFREKVNKRVANNPNRFIWQKNYYKKMSPEKREEKRIKWLNAQKEKFRKNPELRKKADERKKELREQKLNAMTELQKEIFLEKERAGRRKRRLVRQARERNGEIIAEFSKEEIIKRDGLDCYICGKHLKVKEVTIDHVLPLARGGHHKPENAKIACSFCNKSKGAKTLTEYKKFRGDYDRFCL